MLELQKLTLLLVILLFSKGTTDTPKSGPVLLSLTHETISNFCGLSPSRFKAENLKRSEDFLAFLQNEEPLAVESHKRGNLEYEEPRVMDFKESEKTTTKERTNGLEPEKAPVISSKEMENVEVLWQWCLEDIRCTKRFHQEKGPSKTIFYHLLKSHANNISLIQPAMEFLCQTISSEENAIQIETLTKKLWVEKMNSMRGDGNVICNSNQAISYDHKTMAVFCECLPGEDCRTVFHETTAFIVMFWNFTAISSMSLIVCVTILLMGYYVKKKANGGTKKTR